MVDEREIGNRVKQSIIGVLKGTGEIARTAVETVATTVQTTLKQGGETGAAATQLGVGAVKGAIDAVGDVGAEHVAEGAVSGLAARGLEDQEEVHERGEAVAARREFTRVERAEAVAGGERGGVRYAV